MLLRPNSTSTTGPITRTTRPVLVLVSFSIKAVMSLFASCRSEGVGAADDLADFLGDLGLASLVRQSGVSPDQFGGVVAGRLHRPPPGGRLRGGRLQQRREDP